MTGTPWPGAAAPQPGLEAHPQHRPPGGPLAVRRGADRLISAAAVLRQGGGGAGGYVHPPPMCGAPLCRKPTEGEGED